MQEPAQPDPAVASGTAPPVEPATALNGAETAADAAQEGGENAFDALWDNFGTEDAVDAAAASAPDVAEGASGLLDGFFAWIWPFFDWSDQTAVGIGIRESLWLFPVIEAFHLVTFAVLGGTILLVDLRLLGLAFRSQPVAELARAARPWFIGSLLMTITSGVLLYFSEPVKLYYSNPFWIKMAALASGITLALTIRRKVTAADPARIGPVWGRVVGAASILFWATVAWGGRWIGFS